jgi:uncharacterized protein
LGNGVSSLARGWTVRGGLDGAPQEGGTRRRIAPILRRYQLGQRAGGVLDPAARLSNPRQAPRPDIAVAPDVAPAFRLLLHHNPKLAPLADKGDFDLQLSGHTHAGQFFPWTLAIHLVHALYVAGLSRRGRVWVYVSGPASARGARPCAWGA